MCSSNKLHVLVSEKTEAHLPMCEINHNRNLHSTLRKFMTVIIFNMYLHIFQQFYGLYILFLGDIWC